MAPQPGKGEETAKLLSAALWMLAGIFALSSVAVAGREVSANLDTFELMFYRSVLGVPIVWSLAQWRQVALSTDRLALHLTRNSLHFAAQNLWFYALALIPLAQVFALEFTTPLWVILLAPFVLQEWLSRQGLIAVVLGFLGILVIVRPGLEPLSLAHGAALLSALGFAGTVLATKTLTATEPSLRVLFYMTTMQAALGLCFALPGGMALPTVANGPWLLVLGLCGLGAHFCITQALSLAPAKLVSPLDFFRLPLIAVVGAFLYEEALELPVLLGGGLIIVGNLLNLRGARNSKKV